MEIRIAKWGNSLALRLPATYARDFGLKAGDTIEAKISPSGELRLMPRRPFNLTAWRKKLKALHAKMPQTEPVIEQMRAEARY